MKKTVIQQARIFDPAQQWRGEIRDLHLCGGRVSETFPDPDHVINASGRCLMAGAVEPNCLLAAPGQNLMRWLHGTSEPEAIGQTYARMGVVHVHHPLATLLTAGLVHRTLRRIPYVDTSVGVCIDLRDMASFVRTNRPGDFQSQARALIRLSGALGLMLPFPFLRHRQRHYIHKNLSPKKVLGFLSAMDDEEILPVSLWATPDLLETEIPAPGRFHLSGLGAALNSDEAVERAGALLDAGASADLSLIGKGEPHTVSSQEPVPPGNVSIDVGIHYPLQHLRSCGPLEGGLPNAGQRLLEKREPGWRLAFSASGPSGNLPEPFSEAAAGFFAPLHQGLDLYEWAERTRREPARILGLEDLGHLCLGARANVVIYDLVNEAGKEKTADAFPIAGA